MGSKINELCIICDPFVESTSLSDSCISVFGIFAYGFRRVSICIPAVNLSTKRNKSDFPNAQLSSHLFHGYRSYPWVLGDFNDMLACFASVSAVAVALTRHPSFVYVVAWHKHALVSVRVRFTWCFWYCRVRKCCLIVKKTPCKIFIHRGCDASFFKKVIIQLKMHWNTATVTFLRRRNMYPFSFRLPRKLF